MNTKKNKILVCLLLFMVSILFLLNGFDNNTNLKVNELISQGQMYIQEENYKKALYSFEEAIKLDDRCVEAYVGDKSYQISRDLVLKSVLEDGRVEEVPADDPFPAGRRYYSNGLKISTFLVDDERGQGEVIHSITATKDAKTPRKVGIGDTLAALQDAYPDLIYLNDYYSNDEEMKYNRCYAYVPDDGTNKFIQFYLYEKKIVMIETGDGLDICPGSWQQYDNIFGMKNIYKEINDVTPKGMDTKYFYINDAGEE